MQTLRFVDAVEHVDGTIEFMMCKKMTVKKNEDISEELYVKLDEDEFAAYMLAEEIDGYNYIYPTILRTGPGDRIISFSNCPDLMIYKRKYKGEE